MEPIPATAAKLAENKQATSSKFKIIDGILARASGGNAASSPDGSNRSEGFALTGYVVPGAWRIGFYNGFVQYLVLGDLLTKLLCFNRC